MNWLKRLFCAHLVYIDTMHIVHAGTSRAHTRVRCVRCGKLLLGHEDRLSRNIIYTVTPR